MFENIMMRIFGFGKKKYEVRIRDWNPLINKDLKNAVIDLASWKTRPRAFRAGRSAHLLLQDPFVHQLGMKEVSIRTLRLKGVGNFNDKGKGKPPFVLNFLENILPGQGRAGIIVHMATNEKHEIFPELENMRSKGALSASAARKEYEITGEGLKSWVPFNIPICWGSYNDLKFEGEEMGFVVLGLRDRQDRRFGDLTRAEMYESEQGPVIHFNDYLHSLLSVKNGKQATRSDIIVSFQKWGHGLGQALRSFNDAGFLRFAAHSGNYSVDEQSKEIVLTDVDSSVRRSEIDERTIFLSQLFGIVSGIRGIHEIAVNTAFGFIYLQEPVVNPYFPFLKGYFPEYVPRSMLSEISDIFWQRTKQDMEDGFENYFANRHSMDILAISQLFGVMEVAPLEGLQPPYSSRELSRVLERYDQKVLGLQKKNLKRGIKALLG